MTVLPPQAVRSYWKDGYCVVSGCVDSHRIDAFLRDLATATQRQLTQLGLANNPANTLEALHDNLAALFRHDQQLYVAMLRVCARLKSLYDAFFSENIAEACRNLGVSLPMHHTRPVFHLISNRLKIAGGYQGFQAHQDWPALQTSLNTITVWLPFHDVELDNFPLEVIPGSHLRGLLPAASTSTTSDYAIDPACFEASAFVALKVSRGDAVLFSPFTVHRTGLTPKDSLRLAASWRYEDAAESSFVERRYPLAWSETVRLELFQPGFPDATQIARAIDESVTASPRTAQGPRRNESSD